LNKSNGGIWLYDFTDIKNKKIIEFHGDMFHGNPKKYKSSDNPNPFNKTITAQSMWDKDEKKYNIANKEGFEVLIIWDSEYRWDSKDSVVEKCITFLNSVK
jgi:G:T-mismatch repair DNA endonuclease (very short patch repair protein)